MAVVRDYDFHPPDDLRLFPMPRRGVLRLDDRAFVAVVRYGDIVVWHYAFADHWLTDHWFRVNAPPTSTASSWRPPPPGRCSRLPSTATSPTPLVRQGDAVLAVELFLDVLVRRDGITHGVYEQREFDQAIRRG